MAETNGAIYGIVSEEGNIKVGNDVVLMDHATLTIIAKTITDQYGGYMFCNLDPNKTDYMLFTIDNDGVTPKNALIKDYVQPVTSNNGTTEGSFVGVLDALAPVASGIPARRNGATSTPIHINRLHGGSMACGYDVDWNGHQAWTDSSASPATPATACPIPSNQLIRGIKHTAGWSGYRQRPPRFDSMAQERPKSELQPAITTAAGQGNFTMMFSHYTDPAGPMTYSLCYDMRPDYTESYRRAGWGSDIFYPDNSTWYTTECHFNVCVEANHELRLKWLVDNGGVPNSASKRNVLVATLSANKWYLITVRAGATTDTFKVDVCDVYAGTVTTYTTAATLESINKHQNYGSTHTNGVPVRAGFKIHGPHNQAVNNTFNTWNTSTGWAWQAFATGNGYSGPWAWWNRRLTDAEVAELLNASFNTSVAKVPRGLAEIYKHCPQLYIPFDEYPGATPWATRKGQALIFAPYQSAKATEYSKFSLRRRKVVHYGGGYNVPQMSIPNPHVFTVIAFFYQPVADGSGCLINLIAADTGYDYDVAPNNQIFHQLYLAVESGGRPRAYWRNTGDGYNDNYPGPVTSALQNVGLHMVAWEFDVYYGLKVNAYVDGVLHGTSTVAQQQIDNHRNGIGSQYSIQARMLLNTPWVNSAEHAFQSMGTQLRSTPLLTDIAFFTGCLGATAIAEIYNAWALAVGPDSHV